MANRQSRSQGSARTVTTKLSLRIRFVNWLIRQVRRLAPPPREVNVQLKGVDFYTELTLNIYHQTDADQAPWVAYAPHWRLLGEGDSSGAAILNAWSEVLTYTREQRGRAVPDA